MYSLSIVIPVYNGALSIEQLTLRLEKILPQVASNYELIFVDDDSRDRSWEVIRILAQQFSWVQGIHFTRNFGQHNALLCGIRRAKYDVIVTMDDDLQHPPEELPKLLDTLTDEYDVVYGTPQKERHGPWRDLASQVTKLVLQNAMGAETARNISPFRVFRTHLRDAFAIYQGPFVSIDVLLTWGTARFTMVPVRHDIRKAGVSNYTFSKLTRHTFDLVTGFSTIPLKLASLIGFSLTLFGFIILIYVIGRFMLQGSSVPGFPFLASLITLFSGAQLFSLGIIGEYLGRMHFRIMDRPTYLIRDTTLLENEDHSYDN